MSDLAAADSQTTAAGAPPQDLTLPRRPWRRSTTPWARIVGAHYDGDGSPDKPYLIGWLPDEQENPMDFAAAYKWALTVFVSFATLAVALSSSAYSGATREIGRDLGGSPEVLTLGISLFVLGFAIGPLFWAPLSELFGRRNLLIVSYAFLTLWTGLCIASPNIGAMVAFRFLAGAFGSSPLTNAGGVIADTFSANQRGLATSVFAAAPFLGPALGPITGGFLTIGTGRWQPVFIFLTVFSGIILLLGAAFCPETYAPVLLRQRAARLSRATGKVYVSRLDAGKSTAFADQMRIAIVRPWQLLFREPIVFLMSLYVACVYGVLYAFFSAMPIVFQQVRGWNAGVGGLAFLGVLVGMMAGVLLVIVYFNPEYVRVANKSPGGLAPPETRLRPAFLGAVALVVGLAIFTGTDGPQIHWFVPIALGGAPFGMGMVLLFLSIQNYLIDAYLIYAASVLAANSVIRSLFGAAFPLFTRFMYMPPGCPTATCGIHVGPGIATGLSVLFLPLPFLFYKYGESIRRRCKYAAEAAQQLELMRTKSRMAQGEVPSEGSDAVAEKAETQPRTYHNADAGQHSDESHPATRPPTRSTSDSERDVERQ